MTWKIRGTLLWNLALEQDPGDDYGAAQLRTAYVASGLGLEQAGAEVLEYCTDAHPEALDTEGRPLVYEVHSGHETTRTQDTALPQRGDTRCRS